MMVAMATTVPDSPPLYDHVTSVSAPLSVDPYENPGPESSWSEPDSWAGMKPVYDPPRALRPIIIDGSNVAMNHGNKRFYSCRGIQICVDWFLARGHTDITVFVPQWRTEESREETPVQDREILYKLEAQDRLVFTPSRKITVHVEASVPASADTDLPPQSKMAAPAPVVRERRVTCYDDRYVVKVAAQTDGIIVSNDNYRDLARESPAYARVISDRLLMYTFFKDSFMPPDDPLGRNGPSLDEFLMMDPPGSAPKKDSITIPVCPYGPKCTYGNKCKFSHPERKNKTRKVTEELAAQAQVEFQKFMKKDRTTAPNGGDKKPLCRTYSLQSQPQNASGLVQQQHPRMSLAPLHQIQAYGVPPTTRPFHQRGGSLKNNETRKRGVRRELKHESSLPLFNNTLIYPFSHPLNLPPLQMLPNIVPNNNHVGGLLGLNGCKKMLGKTASDPCYTPTVPLRLGLPNRNYVYAPAQPKLPPSPVYDSVWQQHYPLNFISGVGAGMGCSGTKDHNSPTNINTNYGAHHQPPSHCPTIPETVACCLALGYLGPSQVAATAAYAYHNIPLLFNNLELVDNVLPPPAPVTMGAGEFGRSPDSLPVIHARPQNFCPTPPTLLDYHGNKNALKKKLSAPPFLHSDSRGPIPGTIDRGPADRQQSPWYEGGCEGGPPTQPPNRGVVKSLDFLNLPSGMTASPPYPNHAEPRENAASLSSLPPNILSFLSEYDNKQTPSTILRDDFNSPNSVGPDTHRSVVEVDEEAWIGNHNFDVEHQNKRLKLYFHLASLFPEDHVKVIMNRFPNVTDPRKLCSVLLKM